VNPLASLSGDIKAGTIKLLASVAGLVAPVDGGESVNALPLSGGQPAEADHQSVSTATPWLGSIPEPLRSEKTEKDAVANIAKMVPPFTEKPLPAKSLALKNLQRPFILGIDIGLDAVEIEFLEAEREQNPQGFCRKSLAPHVPTEDEPDLSVPMCQHDVTQTAGSKESAGFE
jgi:hypothetical protein